MSILNDCIIRQVLETGKWRVYDSSFYDDGERFETELEALYHAKSRGYKFADVPSGGAISIGIDILIKNRTTE